MNQAYWNSMGCSVAQNHCRDVRYHHPKGCSHHDKGEALELGGQRNRSNLGFIAHFGQEERDKGGAKDAHFGQPGFFLIQLVRNEGPDCHSDKRDTEHPAKCLGGHQGGDPGADRTGKCVIGEGCCQNAQDDGDWPPEFGCQEKSEKLGFVADFG